MSSTAITAASSAPGQATSSSLAGPNPEPPNPQPPNPPDPSVTVSLAVTVLLNDLTGGYPINTNPVHATRPMRVQLIPDGSSTPVQTFDVSAHQIDGQSAYNAGTPTFTLGAPGTYRVRARLDYTLYRSTTVTINANGTVSVPAFGVVVGDVNEDGSVNAVDYDLIMNCIVWIEDVPPEGPCDGSQKRAADLDDDGLVGPVDYNLYLRQVQNL